MLQPLELEKPPTLKDPIEREWERILSELKRDAAAVGVAKAEPNARELAKLVDRMAFRQFYQAQYLQRIAELVHESLISHTHRLEQKTVYI
jgi:hypothetical protein